MALFSPSESPAVVVKEIDLTNGVANVPTSTGAFVGDFSWGPCDEPTRVNNEASLVGTFGAPTTTNTIDFHSASSYLRYSDDLYIVREYTALAKNAYDSDASSSPLVTNVDNWEDQAISSGADSHTFIARWPGELGNSLKISVAGAADVGYASWPYKSFFDGQPQTSIHAVALDSAASTQSLSTIKDEAHVVVIDEDGKFTGTRGTILETFPYVSMASNAKTTDGTSSYIKNVINKGSKYIWMGGFNGKFGNEAGTPITTTSDYSTGFTGDVSISLVGGVNSAALTTTDYATGFDKFEDPNALSVDFLIAPGVGTAADQVTIVNDLVGIAQTIRKDCMVITSPYRGAIVGAATPVTTTLSSVGGFTRSSYLSVDNNYLKVYDKYNDQYIKIPAASSTAGIMAATDNNFAPWFSPAGTRRGQYFGVTSLAYSPNKSERDQLYQAGINPIANIPGQGILLYGDKTHLARPSAFDRINVRRLFLVLERAISNAAQNILFEFNDEFTRAEFVNVVEPLLRDVKGRRGITDFKMVCDETNNTPLIIDTNQFVATLFIKPARSINFITLNFTAVRTGVAFEEVVGTLS